MPSKDIPARTRFKVNQLVWIDDPGFPNNDWDGASCIVEDPKAGEGGRYVRVRCALPMGKENPATNLFHPEEVKPETRKWLAKALRQFLRMRDDLLSSAERICEEVQGKE